MLSPIHLLDSIPPPCFTIGTTENGHQESQVYSQLTWSKDMKFHKRTFWTFFQEGNAFPSSGDRAHSYGAFKIKATNNLALAKLWFWRCVVLSMFLYMLYNDCCFLIIHQCQTHQHGQYAFTSCFFVCFLCKHVVNNQETSFSLCFLNEFMSDNKLILLQFLLESRSPQLTLNHLPLNSDTTYLYKLSCLQLFPVVLLCSFLSLSLTQEVVLNDTWARICCGDS